MPNVPNTYTKTSLYQPPRRQPPFILRLHVWVRTTNLSPIDLMLENLKARPLWTLKSQNDTLEYESLALDRTSFYTTSVPLASSRNGFPSPHLPIYIYLYPSTYPYTNTAEAQTGVQLKGLQGFWCRSPTQPNSGLLPTDIELIEKELIWTPALRTVWCLCLFPAFFYDTIMFHKSAHFSKFLRERRCRRCRFSASRFSAWWIIWSWSNSCTEVGLIPVCQLTHLTC